jgi:hypothetical protein
LPANFERQHQKNIPSPPGGGGISAYLILGKNRENVKKKREIHGLKGIFMSGKIKDKQGQKK